ncbi:MAG: hypothetical protein U9N87_06375 [Planctomycetota bacterium]|nr:hypothetical protein [Planctomycetota bacterium]
MGIAILFSASSVFAQGWSFSGSQKKTKPSSTTQTLKKLDAGTKKFFRDAVDVITLKPLWGPDKKPKKKSFWDSWFTSKEEPRKAATVSEWVGQKRPK